ncbi:4-alpha-glucanotransferase [Oleispirillum naphthae]|uniref:4-alpha-glucanotransferase n=1 Tax=Oleispirillum naphthae TaxID=2838853 RepID=UPI00308235C4
MQALGQLAEEAGIHRDYWDIAGTLHVTSDATKRAILAAMGISAATDAEAAQSLTAWRERPWRDLLPPVVVVRRFAPDTPVSVEVAVPDELAFSRLGWRLEVENGDVHEDAPPACALPVVAMADIGGRTVARRRLDLPTPLPEGYHTLSVRFAGRNARTRVIVAPPAAYVPGWMAAGERRWGLACQLYGLKRAKDWGVGDFAALEEAMAEAGKLGAAMLGINPLHALFPPWPDACSPYSPSSRVFLNPLMIAVDEIGIASPGLDAFTARDCVKKTLRAAKRRGLIDYPAVSDAKFKALAALYADFLEMPAEKTAAFEAFCVEGGDSLRRFAEFSALHETMGGLPWNTWPAPFQDPDSPEVAAYALANAGRVTFHAFLQWLAEGQLAAAARRNPGVGLYRDLAIGASADGADAWANQGGLVTGASFGAPPDAFSAVGQDWGLPPPHPHRMRDDAYAGFAALLRANMRHAAALRLDHVMGLMRLFWIPNGTGVAEGAYVSYPFDDLLAIVALESVRNRCVVIGEDLGTVPDACRARMAAERLLSYRVLYFEKWPSGLFKRPEAYPPLALVTPTTHDMPTIAGHWQGRDVALRAEIGLFGGPEEAETESRNRAEERAALAGALADQGLSPEPPPAADPAQATPEALAALTASVLRFAARPPSALLMVNVGDMLAEDTQINLPGTVAEHPNWSRRMKLAANKIAANPAVRTAVAAIRRER